MGELLLSVCCRCGSIQPHKQLPARDALGRSGHIRKLDQLDRSAIEWFGTFMPKSGIRQPTITAAYLGAVEPMPVKHSDPFDRLIVAQAINVVW